MKIKIVPAAALLLAFTIIGTARSETTADARGSESARAPTAAQAQTIEQLFGSVARVS